MEGYETYLRDHGFSDNSVRSYLYAAKQLNERLETLNNEELLAHKDWLIATYSAKTVNIRIVAINSYLDYLGYEGVRLAGLRIQQKPLSNRPLQSMRYCEWEPLVANVRYWHREPSIFRKGAACCYLRLAMSESRRRRFSAWRIESGPRTS